MSVERFTAHRMRCDTCGAVCARTGENVDEARAQAGLVGWWLKGRVGITRFKDLDIDQCAACAFETHKAELSGQRVKPCDWEAT